MKLTWLWLSMLIAGNAIAWTGYITNQNDQIYSIHPGSDLSGADFSGLNLTYAELEGANLSGANFNNSILDFADLSGARLDEATFTGANLYATRLVNALLVDTSFISSHAKNADFSKAFGLFMVSSNSTFTAADFSKADMRYANLRDSVFDRADFSGSLLSNSTLTNNTYENTVFIGSDIENQFSASTNGVLTLDALTEDYITRDVAISNWVDSVFSTTDEVIGVSNAFIAADTALSNVLTTADLNFYYALSANISTNREISDLNYHENRVRIYEALSESDYQDSYTRSLIDSLSETSATNIAAINAQLDGSMVTNSASVSDLSNVSTVGTATSYDYLLGTSVTNSTLERILQELTQPSEYYETDLGAGGSRIDRLAQELLTDYHTDHPLYEWLRTPSFHGSDESVISQIIQELSTDGLYYVNGEHNLGNRDPSRSRLTKVIEELMGAYDGTGESLGSGDPYSQSLVRRMAQELDGYNLSSDIGTSGTAMSRITEEFSEHVDAISDNEFISISQILSQSNTAAQARAAMLSSVTATNEAQDVAMAELSDQITATNSTQDTSIAAINAQLDGSMVTNSASVSDLSNVSTVGTATSYDYLLGTSVTNSTLERILQELTQPSEYYETDLGAGGSRIDRLAQELLTDYHTDHPLYEWLRTPSFHGSDESVISQIIQELSTDGLYYVNGEHNLGNRDPSRSRLTKVIEELMGAYDGTGESLGSGDPYSQSLVRRMAQELDGYNLSSDIGTSGTAMSRITEEFSEHVDAISDNEFISISQILSQSNTAAQARAAMLSSVTATNEAQDVAMAELSDQADDQLDMHNNLSNQVVQLQLATNNLSSLIMNMQSLIQDLSSRVASLEISQGTRNNETNWWDDAGSFDNIASNLVDGRVGSTVVSVNGGQASLQMNFETTSSLTEGWEPATNVNVVIPVGESDSQFFRMGFE